MNISPLSSAPVGAEKGPSLKGDAQARRTPGFADTLERAAEKVNVQQLAAEGSTRELAAGESADIAQTMLAITKADLSLRLLVQVRNKALAAYEEIMRMQL